MDRYVNRKRGKIGRVGRDRGEVNGLVYKGNLVKNWIGKGWNGG